MAGSTWNSKMISFHSTFSAKDLKLVNLGQIIENYWGCEFNRLIVNSNRLTFI